MKMRKMLQYRLADLDSMLGIALRFFATHLGSKS